VTLKSLRAWLMDWAESREHSPYPGSTTIADEMVARSREPWLANKDRKKFSHKQRWHADHGLPIPVTAQGKDSAPSPTSRPPRGSEMWAHVRALDTVMKQLAENREFTRAIRTVQLHYIVGHRIAAQSMRLPKQRYYEVRNFGERTILAAFQVRQDGHA